MFKLLREYWFTTFSIVILIAGLATTTYLVQQKQEFQSLASIDASPKRLWSYIHNWIIWTKDIQLSEIEQSNFELAVIDYSSTGTDENTFTRQQIEKARTTGCAKRMVAIINVGNAENYRFYWQASWQQTLPGFIAEQDSTNPSSYFVKFWDPAWQQIVYQTIDKAIAQGFDGVYLTNIDVYKMGFAQGHEIDMVDFIHSITQYSHQKSPLGQDFGIIVENTEEFGTKYPSYLSVVTGIAKVNNFVQKGVLVTANERITSENQLDVFKQNSLGKLVLTLDITTNPIEAQYAYTNSLSKGYAPYMTNYLSSLTTYPGLEPTCNEFVSKNSVTPTR